MDTLLASKRNTVRLPDPPGGGLVEVVRVLLLLQGAFATLVVVELGLWIGFSGMVGGLGVSLLLTAASAAAAFILAAALGRHARLARRLTFLIEGAILLLALVDLGLAVFIAHRSLDLVPTITRLVMPVVVIVVLRRPSVRVLFPRRISGGVAA
jgi:hypothetical protein